MAYNREWDRGNESWNNANYDNNAWNNGAGNIRSREDEYYGEGKRRKYNNGGYDASYSYDETSYDSSYNQGRQQDFSQDHAQDDRALQRNKKRLVPSEPSPHVIFLGLDPDFTEADLQAYLSSNGCNIETVTIIRERSTGVSKGFGFAQFASSEHARAFVDPLFPFIQVPPPASHGASATAAFHKALETGAGHNGRRVKIDYSQSATPHEKGRSIRQNMNDGTRDIGNAQAPVLLFRGLDPLSGPQAIHQAMKGSSGAGKEGAKGMKRIVLIKDKVTMASFGFAFVEFIDIQSAAAVLAATMSPQIHPSGFRISDRPVAGSFAHPYSFQSVSDYMLRDEAAITSSVTLGGAEGAWVRYWDESSTVAVLEFEVEMPVASQETAPSKEKKEKKKKGDTGITALPTASALPVSDKPVTLSFSKGPMASKPLTNTSGAPLAFAFSSADDGDSNESGDAEKVSDSDKKIAAAKKVAPLIASKKTTNNINKWNQVQEELTNDTDATPALAASRAQAATPAAVMPTAPATKSAGPATVIPVEKDFEFSDMSAMTCLLCARKFKSQDQLDRHNKESDLHKKNFKNPNLRDVARQKAEAAKMAGSPSSIDQPKYRDRASERRIMHNQPDVPLPAMDAGKSNKKKQAEGPPPPPSPPPPPANPGQDQNNVGNKLLKMMGWTEGTGLGTTGEGRVEPIQTSVYAQGAGLGASKPKDIGKYTEAQSGSYADKAQDAARERYGS